MIPLDESLLQTGKILNDLHLEWKPHPKQLEVLLDIFEDKVKDVFVECGRKFGKTELVIYVLWRFALFNPNAGCYYIAPFQKQAREIVWVTNRIQNFIPREYIKSVNNTEMRVTLTNGSFIKVDGSDNYDAYRGIQPHIVVYDEYKDFRAEFHAAMNPNRSVFDSPLVIIGTPPDKEGHYTELLESYKKSSEKKYYNFPTWENPLINTKWLKHEKEVLYERGEEDVWQREYGAKFVRGGKNSIFPSLSHSHIIPHTQLIGSIRRDKHKFQYYATADPGTSSCFAVLFCALNPHTKEWWILDEIYEKDPKYTSTASILPRIQDKRLELNSRREWFCSFDEAAAWWANEVHSIDYSESWCPTAKALHKRDIRTKEPWGLSLIKDALRLGKVKMSDRCKNLYWEMNNYVKIMTRDGQSRVPKMDDHLIDCLRYTFAAANYHIAPEVEIPEVEPDRARRGYSLDEDLLKDSTWAGEREFYD